MIERKKRILLIQLTLLFFGVAMIYGTYYSKTPKLSDESKTGIENKKIEEESESSSDQKDVFFNIEYAGSDLTGNRYILKSEEAFLDELKPEIVYMKKVSATFYFKDNTKLYVWSDKGIYNNKTLDMKFEDNVKANYLNNELFAEKADYSNRQSFLTIYEKVRVNNETGNLIADKLLFDVKNKKLDITSFKDGAINANIKLNEKRF